MGGRDTGRQGVRPCARRQIPAAFRIQIIPTPSIPLSWNRLAARRKVLVSTICEAPFSQGYARQVCRSGKLSVPARFFVPFEPPCSGFMRSAASVVKRFEMFAHSLEVKQSARQFSCANEFAWLTENIPPGSTKQWLLCLASKACNLL